jgi:Family of unknown function (DUF6151)
MCDDCQFVYAGCCRTPVAHIPSPKIAFVGIPHLCMRHGPLGESRDVMLGPLVHRLQARYCRGERPEGAHLGTPVRLRAGGLVKIAWDTLRGRQRPSPFHEAGADSPAVVTTVLGA